MRDLSVVQTLDIAEDNGEPLIGGEHAQSLLDRGAKLGRLRTFLERRAGVRDIERTAAVAAGEAALFRYPGMFGAVAPLFSLLQPG